MKKLFLAATIVVLASGCTMTRYKSGDKSLTHIAPAWGNRSIGSIDLEKGTMEGFRSEQAEAFSAVAEGAAKGAINAMSKQAP